MSPMGWPSTQPSPPVGARRPSSSFTAVVLPAPLGPRKPNTSPRGTVMVRPARATVRPKCFDSSTQWMAGEAAAVTAAACLSWRSTNVFQCASPAPCRELRKAVRHRQQLVLGQRPGDAVHPPVLDPDDRTAEARVVADCGAVHAL